ncbi:hypothetical protein ACOMHN_030145 [Nucella lapillus]
MTGRINCDIVRTWQNAVEAVEDGRLEEAVSLFLEIQHYSAKIWFNLSTVDILQGNFKAAYEKLKECLQRDKYLVVAHFQRGVVACCQGRLRAAREMFMQAEKNLRHSDSIDYNQLGLDLRLTRQQILHNMTTVDNYLRANRQMTEIPERELELLPPVSLFRPARSLVDNIEKKNFLQSAKVISAVPEIARDQHGNVVRHSQSSSAPTSPSTHRRKGLNPQPTAARTPPPSRPPPCRPPPRLPPSSRAHSGTSHRHDDSARQEVGSRGPDGPATMVVQQGAKSGGSSCLPRSGAALPERSFCEGNPAQGESQSQSRKGNPSSLAQSVRGLHSHDGAVDRQHVSSAASSSNSVPVSVNPFSFTSCSPSTQLSDRLETEKTSSPERSIAERLKRLETNRSSQGQSAFGMKSSAHVTSRRPGQGKEVKGQRSWSKGEVAAGPKPARPSPPKFVS